MDEAETLWVYVSRYPDGTVGTVSTLFALPPLPPAHSVMMGRNREAVEKLFGRHAREHAERTGQPVWLREYVKVKDHEEVGP